jgi:hypothetical protein
VTGLPLALSCGRLHVCASGSMPVSTTAHQRLRGRRGLGHLRSECLVPIGLVAVKAGSVGAAGLASNKGCLVLKSLFPR